jgi:hypothetical protein
VSRTRCSVKRCSAEPGPSCFIDPGSAAHRRSRAKRDPESAALRPGNAIELRLTDRVRRPYIEPVVICFGVFDMASRPRDLASRMAGRRKPDDGYLRETFTLPREAARTRARDFFRRYPKAAYMSSVESWRELPDGAIEFTMRRLASAD